MDARGGGLGFVTSRPVAITMFVIAFAVFGVVSLYKLPLDLLPEISYPTLTVRTTYEGAAPEDVEDRVSRRIQEALSTLPNLVRSTSISRAETSDVVLEFDWGTEMTFAVQDVRDKLDGVFLPEVADRPLILRYDPNLDPILRIGLSTPEGKRAGNATAELVHLRWVAEKRVKRELETLPGVAAVLVRGGLEEEIRVRVDPFRLAAQGLSPETVALRLEQENLNASGGMIREGSTDYLVRTLNEFADLEEIANLALVRRGPAAIRVRDVAEVERTHAEREVISRLNGREAVEIAVYREAGANIVGVADRVKERVLGTEAQRRFTRGLEASGTADAAGFMDRAWTDYVAWRWRSRARFAVLSDQSTFIRDAIDDLKSSAVAGALLAVLVLWVFLRSLPPTLIIGVTIPITVVATFAPMYLLGVSLNVMSLGGLALGVGMLLDNSIVVLESIQRCRTDGDSFFQAVVRGTREVAAPMTATTLTTVSVFLPIVFVHGIAGQIFGDQAVTVVASQIISLLVGVIFIPMLASRRFLAGAEASASALARPGSLRAGLSFGLARFIPSLFVLAGRLVLACLTLALRLVGAVFRLCAWAAGKATRPLVVAFDRLWQRTEAGYLRLLRTALHRPGVVLALVAVLCAAAWWRVQNLGVELLPEIHQGEFTLHVGLDTGSPIENTDQVLGEIEREIRALPDVQLTALTVGVEVDTLTRDIEGPNTARLTVRLASEAAGVEREEALLTQARSILARHPSVRSVEVSRPTPFALEAPVAVEILGHDLHKIAEVAEEVRSRVMTIPGLSDVRTTLRAGHPEALVVFDRDKTLEFGLDLTSVSNLVRDQLLGNVSTRFNEGEDRLDVRVIGDEITLSNLERVLDLVVNPGADNPVELRSVARVVPTQGPAEIRRIGNSRAIVVTAAGSGLDLGGFARQIESSLATLTPPSDVVVELGGQKREMSAAQASMRAALLLAIFLVYVVMACQFESLLQPLIILVSVPLAGVGVVFVLEALSIPLSVTVFLGLILLSGIVVNNAIVLIDRVNQRRAQGDGLAAALVEAGGTRLRPILMTTATTVLGLLPLTGWFEGVPVLSALGGGAGAELRAPMAIAVIAGMSVSTLLTLVVVPTLYYLIGLPGERRALARARAQVHA